MIKFNPRYRVTVYSNEATVVVKYPLTMQATVTRGVLSDSTSCNIKLFNLAPNTRNQIFKDVFTLAPEEQKYVHLEAGYGGENSMSMIFKGRILQAYSYKAGGQTDVITEIQAQALDMFDCVSNYTFEAGTTYKEAYKRLAADMPNVQIGAIGTLEGQFLTPTTFSGQTLECLNTLTGGHTYVDNGVLNTLMNNEVLTVPVPVITDDASLLETPIRRDANLEVKMLFEPSLSVGQLLEIKSSVAPDFNGQYKVLDFTHNILISETQAGQRITTANLWIGPLLPSSVLTSTGDATQTQFSEVKGEQVTPVSISQPSAVLDVYKYIQNNNGAIPNTKITKNISWQEMLGHNNTNSDRLKECTLAVLSNVYSTANKMQNFLDSYYPGIKIIITSGWRSSANNASCGGNPKSKHLSGLAMDFYLQGVSVNSLVSNLKTAWSGWIGNYGSFAHAQTNATQGRANDV